MAIVEGKKAPRFTLKRDRKDPEVDEKVALKDLDDKYVVVYFYPRDNTPGCTTEAKGFRDVAKQLKKLNAVVLGISKDSLASHEKFRDKFDLNFPLLSDPDGKVLAKYDAWGEKNNYGKKYMGIIRSTVVIAPGGKVIKHFPKVRVKGHVDAVVDVIREHASA